MDDVECFVFYIGSLSQAHVADGLARLGGMFLRLVPWVYDIASSGLHEPYSNCSIRLTCSIKGVNQDKKNECFCCQVLRPVRSLAEAVSREKER